MNEADFKRQFIKDIRAEGGYGRRIEDAYSVGFPDMILRPKGLPVLFVEAKVFEHLKFKPSPRQYVELMRLHEPPHSYGLVMGLHHPSSSIFIGTVEKELDATTAFCFSSVGGLTHNLSVFIKGLK